MKGVTYSSTRGCPSQKHLNFRTVVMQGLAHDRGLFVPDTIPSVSKDELESWRSLSFPKVAIEVIKKFVSEDDVPHNILECIITNSCASFCSVDVTPVVNINGHHLLELFGGPTFAFKDLALQILGNFFEYFLSTGSNDGRLAVLGATSGDTGSAAIYGLRGKKGIHCVILYPRGRVSEIQERQMTTVSDKNVHCVAIDGTFDDCQDIVKASFGNLKFRKHVKLGAVNSINWCRVLAQTTYYFWSYLRVTEKHPSVETLSYSVPTGNFGDILAGYYSKRMGLPIDKLVVATNENDILHRFFTTGEYHRKDVVRTLSPSMNICVSSNFERYLYHLLDNDPITLTCWMLTFESTGKLTITGDLLNKACCDYVSARVDTPMALRTIITYYNNFRYMLCPHSAVGVNAIEQLNMINESVVCLATAHPAKFPDACRMAVANPPTPPLELTNLFQKKMRFSQYPNDVKAVQDFMERKITECNEINFE